MWHVLRMGSQLAQYGRLKKCLLAWRLPSVQRQCRKISQAMPQVPGIIGESTVWPWPDHFFTKHQLSLSLHSPSLWPHPYPGHTTLQMPGTPYAGLVALKPCQVAQVGM